MMPPPTMTTSTRRPAGKSDWNAVAVRGFCQIGSENRKRKRHLEISVSENPSDGFIILKERFPWQWAHVRLDQGPAMRRPLERIDKAHPGSGIDVWREFVESAAAKGQDNRKRKS
ncbi:hypothetical protein NKH89_05550 [Mesorhizobium sp. M0923]|uniref:hypothetical protein n=1 Tax=Mesorhizobium sp. M0923 TaxID=2957028 RepID=UPI00333743EB